MTEVAFGVWTVVLQDNLRLAWNLNRNEFLVTNKEGTVVHLLLTLTEQGDLQVGSRWQTQLHLKGKRLTIRKDTTAPKSPFEEEPEPDTSKRITRYGLGGRYVRTKIQ